MSDLTLCPRCVMTADKTKGPVTFKTTTVEGEEVIVCELCAYYISQEHEEALGKEWCTTKEEWVYPEDLVQKPTATLCPGCKEMKICCLYEITTSDGKNASGCYSCTSPEAKAAEDKRKWEKAAVAALAVKTSLLAAEAHYETFDSTIHPSARSLEHDEAHKTAIRLGGLYADAEAEEISLRAGAESESEESESEEEQYKAMCKNGCGTRLHCLQSMYCLTDPKGEEEAWCSGCVDEHWRELMAEGWLNDGEGWEDWVEQYGE